MSDWALPLLTPIPGLQGLAVFRVSCKVITALSLPRRKGIIIFSEGELLNVIP